MPRLWYGRPEEFDDQDVDRLSAARDIGGRSSFIMWQNILRSVALLAIIPGMSGAAHAVCTVANGFNFDFNSQALASLAYGTTYTYTGTSTALGSQNFTVLSTQNGLSSTTVGGEVRPNISASHNGGGTARALVIGGNFLTNGRTPIITGGTRVMVTTIAFASAVRDLTFTMHDIDFGADQFRDWIHVSGTGAATYTGSHTTPFGTNNGAGPYATALSSHSLGPATVPFAITAQQAVGVSVSGNNSTTGNLTVSFTQPVTSVEIRYGNYPVTPGETVTGQQAYSISTLNWCPMPSLTVLKSSTPVDTVGNTRFNIPNADVYYSITVANSNSSPVDAGSIIIGDVLPANVTFFNGDIDGAGPLTGNFEFIPGTSGLSLTAANISYANTPITSFTYTPAAGYDANVKAVRFAPTNAMASNSSFTVRFRARIK
jgi:uncharacterized repeat protein (TIGR01451 family)